MVLSSVINRKQPHSILISVTSLMVFYVVTKCFRTIIRLRLYFCCCSLILISLVNLFQYWALFTPVNWDYIKLVLISILTKILFDSKNDLWFPPKDVLSIVWIINSERMTETWMYFYSEWVRVQKEKCLKSRCGTSTLDKRKAAWFNIWGTLGLIPVSRGVPVSGNFEGNVYRLISKHFWPRL